MNRYQICLVMALFCTFILPAQSTEAMRDSLNDFIRKVYYFKNKSDFNTAIKTLDKAFKVAEDLEDKSRIIDCYNLYAQLHIDFERYEDAGIYLDIPSETLKFYDYRVGEVKLMGLRSLLFAEKKQYYEAIQLLRDAKERLTFRDESLQSTLSYYEGIVHFKRRDYKKSLVIFEKLLPVNNKEEPEYINARILLYISEIHQALGNYNNAMLNAGNALAKAKGNDFARLIFQAHTLMHTISAKIGSYQQAYHHLKEADKVKDIFMTPEIVNTEETLSADHYKTFLERVINQMNIDAKEQQKRVNMSKLTSVLSSALLIIISLLTISLYRNNQIKFKTNDLLLKKNMELEAAKEEAERAMQAKAQFLSTVSHELRTPLYAVTGLTHLLLEENPSESQKEHLKSLKFSGEYLLNFINDILQINKIEAKKLSVQEIPLNINKVLQDVVDSLLQTAKENHNTIALEIDRKTPLELIGDPLKLSQIMINLIGNACKFTKKGEIKVITEVKEVNPENITITFKVKDNGIGISKEMQETIFDSFAQGSVQINRKYGGTGLGLTIVKSLLSLFDSEIRLESSVGKGSCFMFDLTFGVPVKAEEIEVETVKIAVDDQFFNNLHLLLVEDNKINQVITKKMLSKKGMTCDIANDGYEAIEKAKKSIYNAILMDIHMPGISGLKATKEIRKFNKKVPIIALTAISLDESTDDFYEAGCNDVVTKPFKPEVFYEKIGNNILRNIEVDI
ncbi:response regulator [Ascidiimonas aurantiaca]|uniref:response regulator n=1 Tax=Ascidiimonas aurantiaca TaxID=1685432 RepID=UPI0030EC95DC